MPRRKMPPAYPPRYYQERRSGLGCLVGPALLFGGFTAGFVFVFVRGAAGLGQIFGLGVAVLLLGSVIYAAICSGRQVRIIPYYDQPLPGADTFLHGQALARNCLRLDELARAHGVRSISDFGFNDPLRGEQRTWHEASEGLRTVAALMTIVTTRPESVDDGEAVRADLQRIRAAFEGAQRRNIRFAFLLEIGNSTSGLVWERREGTP